ncbi:MAG: hypothetical protein ACLGGV_01975 [Bacteroidia bacterium]
MKKVISILILLTFTAFCFANKSTNNDPNPKEANLIAKAKTALKDQCPTAKGNLSACVKTVSMCYADNYVTEVTFYKSENNCATMVAKVTIDCNKEIISVNCN